METIKFAEAFYDCCVIYELALITKSYMVISHSIVLH